jgi:hypothetical protein
MPMHDADADAVALDHFMRLAVIDAGAALNNHAASFEYAVKLHNADAATVANADAVKELDAVYRDFYDAVAAVNLRYRETHPVLY